MQNIELLAPAGSYEALVAAVQNGANAIYLGGNEFSARAFATNFNREELQAAVAYGHLRNVKIYVTVNTLYEDNQFEKLQDYLLFLQTIKVDALIIQDIGLMSFVKQYFPDFEIHMSTQTSIYNLSAVKYFEDAGVDRVVLARENTLDEIADICQNTINFNYRFDGIEAKIPLLEELLDYCIGKDVILNIEIKTDKIQYPNIERMTYMMIKEKGLLDRVMFSSFHLESLLNLRELDDSIYLGYLYEDN